jgi:hypothetical protein
MTPDRIYIPRSSAKKVQFDNGGSLITLRFHAPTLREFLQVHEDLGEFCNADGFLSIDVKERRSASETSGDTHYLTLNTWKPRGDGATSTTTHGTSHETTSTTASSPVLTHEDIPF